jgi:hypothetical protein
MASRWTSTPGATSRQSKCLIGQALRFPVVGARFRNSKVYIISRGSLQQQRQPLAKGGLESRERTALLSSGKVIAPVAPKARAGHEGRAGTEPRKGPITFTSVKHFQLKADWQSNQLSTEACLGQQL